MLAMLCWRNGISHWVATFKTTGIFHPSGVSYIMMEAVYISFTFSPSVD